MYILDLSNFISSRIGDTAKNIRLIFDKVNRENAVLFLDEFDASEKCGAMTIKTLERCAVW